MLKEEDMGAMTAAAYSMMNNQEQPGKPDALEILVEEKVDGGKEGRSAEHILRRTKRSIIGATTEYLWKCPERGGLRRVGAFLVMPYLDSVISMPPPASGGGASEWNEQEKDGSVVGGLEEGGRGKRARSVMSEDERGSLLEALEDVDQGSSTGKGTREPAPRKLGCTGWLSGKKDRFNVTIIQQYNTIIY